MAKARKDVAVALAGLGVNTEPLDVTLPTAEIPTTSFTLDGQTVELSYMDGKPPILKIPGCRHGQQPHNFLLQMMLGRSDVAVATVASIMERTGGPPKARVATNKAPQQGTWWVQQGGKVLSDPQTGTPAKYTAGQIAARILSGDILAGSKVSRPGMAGWAKPSDCPDIVAELPPPVVDVVAEAGTHDGKGR